MRNAGRNAVWFRYNRLMLCPGENQGLRILMGYPSHFVGVEVEVEIEEAR